MPRIRQLKAPNDGAGGRSSDQHSAPTGFRTDVKDALLQLLAEQRASIIAHLAQVAELATSTAVNLGLSPAQVELTRLGAELHDVGKVVIPASIIDRPGPLDAEEEWFMQRHSEIGERIVAATPALKAIAPIVRAVHERPDGMGYPDGLELEEIPISSRIIAVVDAFDAMTSDRPYQSAMPTERALVELRRHAGTQFDPAVVEASSSRSQTEPQRCAPHEPHAVGRPLSPGHQALVVREIVQLEAERGLRRLR